MLTRPLVLLAALAALLALAPAAHAAVVTVRVEGRTQTIWGKAPQTVVADDALAALRAASLRGEFFVDVRQTSFGPYVSQIGRYPAGGLSGWVFKVNGASPPVGADQVRLRDGDTVLWYWADFDASTFAGPATLLLERTSARCYAAFSQDDAGRRSPARDVRIWITGVPKGTAADGRFCVRGTRGLVHVTRAGAVRSNALR
ncbi:MAG TPA: DUF4430 domain-containing protein [Gaiellaceae bacterium]|nr:DUF4430 domain-containing protein [Gaiellaceae bacterium]